VKDTVVTGQYGSHSCRRGDAGAVATTTSPSAAEQAIVISTLTGYDDRSRRARLQDVSGMMRAIEYDDPERAARLRIEERELEAGGLN
jgi:hypothetical protein